MKNQPSMLLFCTRCKIPSPVQVYRNLLICEHCYSQWYQPIKDLIDGQYALKFGALKKGVDTPFDDGTLD